MEILNYISTHAATKLGGCLTLVAFLKVVEGAKSVATFGDEILMFAAMTYLTAELVCYGSLRTASPTRKRALGHIAHVSFVLAFVLMVAACLMIVYDLS